MCMFQTVSHPNFDVSNEATVSLRLTGIFTLFWAVGTLTRYTRRSSSMAGSDLRPLQNTPSTATISRYNNNRLGAVFSSLHSFWTSRQAAANAVGQNAVIVRRDAYSVILFESTATTYISNDFTSSPDELLNNIVSLRAGRGTNFTAALAAAQSVMVQHWSNERYVILTGCLPQPLTF